VATFKDSTGRDWELAINVPVMKRVQARTGHHLGKLLNDDCKLLGEITEDPVEFVNVLYAMCESQCKVAGVSEEQFGEGLAGDAMDAASNAFLKAIEDFCPSRTRPLIAALIVKGQEVTGLMNQGTADAVSKIQGIDPRTILNSISAPNAGSAPGSLESFPAN
jgi:hypothetical protein